MEGEAGDGDVDGGAGVAFGGGGEGAADGLEDEGEDVAGDEDPVVGFGPEAGVLRAEVEDAEVWLSVSDIFGVVVREAPTFCTR